MNEDDFLKYPSLIHHDNTKDIQWWLDNYDGIANIPYIVREKLDGANVQMLFYPDGSMKVGRRTAWLGAGEQFYDVRKVIDSSPELISYFKQLAITHDDTVRVYCELHGKQINKRVYYGEGLVLSVLDVVLGGAWYTQKELNALLLRAFEHTTQHYLKFANTIICVANSLQEALDVSCDFNSLYHHKNDNDAEGIVIRPYERNVYNGRGEAFIIKKKSAAFDDSCPKYKAQEIVEASELAKAFMGYINENRVLSVFTKHGPLTSVQQISDYIKLVMHDARVDFIKDHPEADVADREIYKRGGNMIVPLLRKHITSYDSSDK